MRSLSVDARLMTSVYLLLRKCYYGYLLLYVTTTATKYEWIPGCLSRARGRKLNGLRVTTITMTLALPDYVEIFLHCPLYLF